MKIFGLKIVCCHKKKRKIRMVPVLGRITEQLAPVVPTPQFQSPKTGKVLLMFQMSDSQQVTLSIAYTDKKGNPTSPPAGATPPQWFVDQASVLALAPAADGMSCVVAAVGPLGSATVSVKVADASGNPLASGAIDITIVGGAPANVVVTPGTPSEQP